MGILKDIKDLADSVRKLRRIADDYTDILCCNTDCIHNSGIDRGACLLKIIEIDSYGKCTDYISTSKLKGMDDDTDDGK